MVKTTWVFERKRVIIKSIVKIDFSLNGEILRLTGIILVSFVTQQKGNTQCKSQESSGKTYCRLVHNFLYQLLKSCFDQTVKLTN